MDPTKKKELSRKRRQNYQSLDGIEWRMRNGEWRVENDEWTMEKGE